MFNPQRINKDQEITPFVIERVLEKNLDRYKKMRKSFDYYEGNNTIYQRVYADPSQPSARVAAPYARYLTNISVGYFVGRPIQYSTEIPELQEKIKATIDYNDDASENTAIATDCAVAGEAFELVWIDEDAEARYTRLDPLQCIPLYADTIDPQLLYVLRYYIFDDVGADDTYEFVEVYSEASKQIWRRRADHTDSFTLIEETPNFFGDIPVIHYRNNEECLGDFTTVVSLIDAYDIAQSDSVNDGTNFSDAYLVLKGMMGTTQEDIENMKAQRVMLIDEDADAKWLTKDSNGTTVEDLKTRLDNDIFKLSGIPDLFNQTVGGNASGTAIRYRLVPMENLTSRKETYFKRGIQRRLELLCAYWKMLASSYAYTDINIIFKRNLPELVAESAVAIPYLKDLLSNKTLMSILPLDLDYDAEEEQKTKEKKNDNDIRRALYDDGFEDNLND